MAEIYIPPNALAVPLDENDVIRVDRSGGTMFTRVAEFAADPAFAGQYASLASSYSTKLGTVTRYATPLFDLDDTDLTSLYWPWPIDMASTSVADPIDRFYMWVSTDHENGGIELWTAPDPLGPWTFAESVNNWITALNSGTATTTGETAAVLYDDANDRFIMWAHRGGIAGTAQGSQVTCWATSPDGLSDWTAQGVALDVDPAEWNHNGHTGYFTPARIGERWFGYHLCGGGATGYRAISTSRDGETWFTDPRPLAKTLTVGGAFVSTGIGAIVQLGGRPWLMTTNAAPGDSGATGSATKILVAPLAPDLRTPIGAPTELFEFSEAWETPSIRGFGTLVFNGKLHVFYSTGAAVGVFTLTLDGN